MLIAVFARGHAHVLLEPLAEITRIRVAHGFPDLVDFHHALPQHLASLLQASLPLGMRPRMPSLRTYLRNGVVVHDRSHAVTLRGYSIS